MFIQKSKLTSTQTGTTMRTISYLFNKTTTDEGVYYKANTSSRGAMSYTGRMLLERFNSKEALQPLLDFGPMDMIGLFEDEAKGHVNPIVIKKAEQEQLIRLHPAFRKGNVLVSADQLENLLDEIRKHDHFAAVNLYLFDNEDEQWYYSDSKFKNFKKLTKVSLTLDDEDHG